MLVKDKWYVCSDHKVVSGPFETEADAKAQVGGGTDHTVCQAKDEKTWMDGQAVKP